MSAIHRLGRSPRRAVAALAALLGLAIVAVVTLEMSVPPDGTAVLGATKKPQPPIIDAGCDVDGVTIDYGASFHSAPGEPQYRVVRAEVGQVAPTCAGATVSVRLLEGAETIATATATADATTVGLAFSEAPPARDVDGVAVEIAGGTVPVPDACGSMAFDRFTVLTAGADTHPGSKDRDLTYGLQGADTIRGDNQHDCLDGGAGADQLFGDNQDDVLLGGEGDDTLDGGSGDDRLEGGPGNDVCIGGAGKNTFIDCEVRR